MFTVIFTAFGLILGLMTENPLSIAVGTFAGAFIGTGIQVCYEDTKKYMTPNGRKKLNKQIKKIDEYDNYWGTRAINITDRNKKK